ncbi:MAG: (2Fe-2S)-binding protein [Parvibaculum sp.]|nr:(2Fe-2S)-binding protein [Parvibaculum sp.]
MAITLKVNGTTHRLDIEPEMPLLWALRDELGLTGTKFGCGVAACGACTVHVDGVATRTCVTPVEAVDGAEITTIEGLAVTSGAAEGMLAPVQQAWIDAQVPQCGYCQSGMLMAVSALLAENPRPTDEDIDAAITNVCRCGTYPRVRAAIRSVTAA